MSTRKAVSILCGLMTVLLISLNTAANEKTILAESEAWANATERDGKGLYWDILRMVYEPEGMTVQPNTSTYKRSVGLLQDGRIDIMVGAYRNEIANVLYADSHFDADRVVAVMLNKNASRWEGESSLKDKHVAYIKGYELTDYLSVEFYKHEYYDRDQIFSLLNEGKMDYFLDAEADIKDVFAENRWKASDYHLALVKTLNLYFTFPQTERGEKLKQIFDRRFPDLIKDGQLKQAYEKWNWEYFPF